MKKFGDLLATLDLLEENMETRGKAADFKARMKPVIKKVRDAQIGDPRRYAYVFLWGFFRDVLEIPETIDKDPPTNSALIQRLLEQLADEGRLPADAGDKWETYALENYDDFVNRKSVIRPKYRGEEVGFDPENTPAQRAANAEIERQNAATTPAAPEDPGFQLGVDINEVDPEFRNVVSDIKDSLDRRSSTSMIEIFLDPAEGPIVQKAPFLNLVPRDQLADEPEVDSDRIVLEIKPDSKLTSQIKMNGAEAIEDMIQNYIQQKIGRRSRVVVHTPERGGTYEEPDLRKPEPPTSEYDAYGECVARHKGQVINENYGRYGGRGPGGTFSVDIPSKGTFEITMENGRVSNITCSDPSFDMSQINLVALANNLKKWKPKDALISAFNTRPTQPAPISTISDSVQRYIPENWKAATDEEIIEEETSRQIMTTRERFRPTRSSQVGGYRDMMGY